MTTDEQPQGSTGNTPGHLFDFSTPVDLEVQVKVADPATTDQPVILVFQLKGRNDCLALTLGADHAAEIARKLMAATEEVKPPEVGEYKH